MAPQVSSVLVVVTVLSAVLAWLSAPATPALFVRRLVVTAAFLLTLIGIGAVAGKTLGDFLRNVHG